MIFRKNLKGCLASVLLSCLVLFPGEARGADAAKLVFPDGELRGLWYEWPKADRREAFLHEAEAQLDKIRATGFNTVFATTTSGFLAALNQPEMQTTEPQAAWDALGELIQAAKQRHMHVHMWYTPWIRKRKPHCPELILHPDWAAMSAEGKVDPEGVCFVRPEVRQFELDLIAKAVDRYPDLAGVHIEEPGFSWKNGCCYCDHCRKFCLDTFGVDIRKDPVAAREMVRNVAGFMCSDFFLRLHGMIKSKRPDIWLSSNGSGGNEPDWVIGRVWATWARRGYLDFYVPQIYTKSVEGFAKKAEATKQTLGACDLVTGMAVSWSSIYPERQKPEVLKAQIAAARKLGAKGFVVFHHVHLGDEHYRAVRDAVQGN